jgi:heme-degrading monooxygenase HmoA
MPHFVAIWRFRVAAERVEEFRRIYGPAGEWVALFEKGEGFLATRLLSDLDDPLLFVTIDEWRCVDDYRAFRDAFEHEYEMLDRTCEGLTVDESLIGIFGQVS